MYVYYYVYYVCTCKQLATFIITFIPKRNCYFNDALVLLILARNTNPLNLICIKRRICMHVLAMAS